MPSGFWSRSWVRQFTMAGNRNRYRDLACLHALCNAHHLRELTYLFEEMGQAWAERLIDLLVEACHEVEAFGKRGRTGQSEALNLIYRLRVHADDVWRFIADHGVTFPNNIAEQAVRIPKVKQKISGGFRTANGLETFCTICSYLDTLHKQVGNLFHALSLTFQGNTPQPHFA